MNLLKGSLDTSALYSISFDFDEVMKHGLDTIDYEATMNHKTNKSRDLQVALSKLGYVEDICFDHECWLTFWASAKGEAQAFDRYETIIKVIDSILQR